MRRGPESQGRRVSVRLSGGVIYAGEPTGDESKILSAAQRVKDAAWTGREAALHSAAVTLSPYVARGEVPRPDAFAFLLRTASEAGMRASDSRRVIQSAFRSKGV